MTKNARTVVLALVALVGLGCLGTGVAVMLFARFALADFGADMTWSEDAVPERDLPGLFGVRLPVKPVLYRSRSTGFQDGLWEVVVQLPPGSAEAFLGVNGLKRGTPVAPGEPLPHGIQGADLLEVVRSFDPGVPALSATQLDLPERTSADAGVFNLYRNGMLLEGPGAVWLYLEAFET